MPGLAVAALAGLACGRAGEPVEHSPLDPAPRHLLLITLAGVRADHTSAYGYPRPTTAWPTDGAQRALGRALAIDDLAERGLVCAEAFAPAQEQLSSLKSLFTGRGVPFGEVLTGLPDEALTLAERLSARGFRTRAFVTGKALSTAGGFDQGFERFEVRPDDADCLRWAVAWLAEEDLGDGRPLFLWVHLAGAEPPWEPGSAPPVPGPLADEVDYVALFLDPERVAATPAVDYAALYPRAPAELTGDPTGDPGVEPGSPAAVDRYDGEVALVGARVRSFLQACKTLGAPVGLLEDSAVVVAGISGTELGLHGTGSSVYAPAVRVPLIFHHPRTVPGRRISDQLVSLTDVTPTVLEWLGLEAAPRERHRRGRSLFQLLAGTGTPLPRAVVTVGGGGRQSASLRDGRMTLVWSNEGGGERAELYDRGLDPLELDDLAAERAGQVTDLRNDLVWLLTEVEP